jgi:methyl-accepting chemotaxis protein
MDRRISETRNDEFGSLFDAFNSTAEHVQGRVGKSEDVVARLPVPPRAVAEVPPDASAETTLVYGSPAR